MITTTSNSLIFTNETGISSLVFTPIDSVTGELEPATALDMNNVNSAGTANITAGTGLAMDFDGFGFSGAYSAFVDPDKPSLINTVTLTANANALSNERAAALFKNRANSIVISMEDVSINPSDYANITFGMFSLSGKTPLFSKTLNDDVSVVDKKIVVAIAQNDLENAGNYYAELTMGDEQQSQILSTIFTVIDTRL